MAVKKKEVGGTKIQKKGSARELKESQKLFLVTGTGTGKKGLEKGKDYAVGKKLGEELIKQGKAENLRDKPANVKN